MKKHDRMSATSRVLYVVGGFLIGLLFLFALFLGISYTISQQSATEVAEGDNVQTGQPSQEPPDPEVDAPGQSATTDDEITEDEASETEATDDEEDSSDDENSDDNDEESPSEEGDGSDENTSDETDLVDKSDDGLIYFDELPVGVDSEDLTLVNEQIRQNKEGLVVDDESGVVFHHIEWGDTLADIAWVYGVPLDDLVQLNQIANPDKIYAGEVLIIGRLDE